MAPDIARLKDLPPHECLSLLAMVRVGRVGIAAGDAPLILPVNFIVLGQSVVFRTGPGTKLGAAVARTAVSFEVDDYAPDGTWGWSVLLHGIASEMAAGPERESIRVALLRAWAFHEGAADRIVRIDPTSITGRGFGHAVQALLQSHGQRPHGQV
jgi:nitroimidazol reductase NimA-like FMN-containing flavoprotein (pyridoxamine 5'-phosphate oxidase superfamily)